MRRIDLDGEGNEADANRPASLSGSDRRLDAVIPFRRKPIRTAAGALAAGAEPPSAPASFVPLGQIVRAVVLRLGNDAVRLNVLAPVREEDDRDQL